VRILLFKPTNVNPTWWYNFLDAHPGYTNTVEQINLVLSPFNCRFSVNNTKKGYGARYLHFKTKSDYLMFILRWS